MCTTSIIALDGRTPGYRLVFNRDELRSREAASPPLWRRVGALSGPGGVVRAIWPKDTAAGGTWIAATERGLTLCLLNLNLEPPPSHPAPHPAGERISRGLLIPKLVVEKDAESVMGALGRRKLERFAPFRLMAVEAGEDGPRMWEARWDGVVLTTLPPRVGPMCFVSSGLGDSRVRARLALFEERVLRVGPTAGVQDEFHRHRWADRPEISVVMGREGARTVSITTVEVTARATGSGAGAGFDVGMAYEAVGDASNAPCDAPVLTAGR